MNYIQTQKFSDVYVSCKTMMPFHRNTISALNVLCVYDEGENAENEFETKISFYLKSCLWNKGVLWFNIYGDLVQLDVRFQFVRPDWIEDGSYLDKIKDIMDEVLFHSVLDEENFKGVSVFVKK